MRRDMAFLRHILLEGATIRLPGNRFGLLGRARNVERFAGFRTSVVDRPIAFDLRGNVDRA